MQVLDMKALWIPLMLMVTACGGAADSSASNEDLGHQAEAIQGGTTLSSSSSAVFLRISWPNAKVVICSGVLVARKAILTAKHCFPDTDTAQFVRISRKLGSSYWQCISRADNTYPTEDWNEPCGLFGFDQVEVHQYQPGVSGSASDLAVVVADKNGVDEWVTGPAGTLLYADADTTAVTTQTLLGFGNNKDAGGGSGQLRSGIFDVTSWTTNTYRYNANDDFQVCHGDSGGGLVRRFYRFDPFLQRTVWMDAVVGLHSAANHGEADSYCADPGLSQTATRLTAAKISFIEAAMNKTCVTSIWDSHTMKNCWP